MKNTAQLFATLLLAGRTVEVTRLGGATEVGTVLADTAPTNCFWYSRVGSPPTLAHIAEARLLEQDPALALLKYRMTLVFESLPVDMRAEFRPTKAAVLDAINDGCYDEVALLIHSAQVPDEYLPMKQALLDLLA